MMVPYKYLFLVLYFLYIPKLLFCWNEWDYDVTWATTEVTAASKKLQWETVWEASPYKGRYGKPRPRRGHSLHIIKTDKLSDYKGATYIVMFGGRDNDQKTTHIPKTYEVESVNGTLVFKTYQDKPVNPCNDPNNTYYSPDEQKTCLNFTTTSTIDVGLIYNDVWAYRLCSQDLGERDFDGACKESGWELWHPGALQGGCIIQLGIEVCTVPSERYNHGSALFDDGCLYVYGGFSQRCQDFCDDIWFFDIYRQSWRQVYSEGQLTKFYTDYFFDEWIPNNVSHVPVDNTTSKFAGPSKRWRHSMVAGKRYIDPIDGKPKQKVAIYGGHRLWHGYSPENSQSNNWGVYDTRPRGGYLDDLWIYTKWLDDSYPGQAFKSNNGKWELKEPREQCYRSAGLSWETRNDIACTTIKPTGRAGHGSAFDDDRNCVWIFGGYTTYYPYLSTDGAGSGPGVTSVGSGGFIPYPGYEYFRNDMWIYNFSSSLWVEIVPAEGSPVPEPRTDAVFLLLGDVIFLQGGFADNYIFDDTWYYNISTRRWLKKDTFVRPIYPPSCTDDFEYIRTHNCSKLLWPKHLKRDENFPYDILPYSEQDYYWPDSNFGPYFGILNKDTSQYGDTDIANSSLSRLKTSPEGTPMFPYAATGSMQYAKPFIYEFNETHNATLFEYCTSVFGEPTRGKVLDGLYGRSNTSIFIAQPRPQKPGWDGCRDRYDGRKDLPEGLQYVKPLPRYGHRAVFHNHTSEIIVYGGMAYTKDQAKTLDDTYKSEVLGDMWYYNLYHCANNCSLHGDCYYGFCLCHVGYYGIDCSNISCPGTFCYYNEEFKQVCTHACQAGYEHTDQDVYVQDIAKIPCSLDHPGESNGICDGFGAVQCAPPFIGDDCSIKDCKDNCSFNGWCSVEYPVSRCMCQPGYYGEICDKKVCLNNCSYPNGVCNTTSGECMCNMMYSPYNNTREFKPWDGEDCSYLHPYAGSPRKIELSNFLAGVDMIMNETTMLNNIMSGTFMWLWLIATSFVWLFMDG